MAEIEDAEHGESGYAREWLTRASRAPRDSCWIADGVMSEQWLPASPVTGKLDAFVWKRPDERRVAKSEAEEAIFRPVSPPAQAEKSLLEKGLTIAIPPPVPARLSGAAEQPSSTLSAQSASEAKAGEASSTANGAAHPAAASDAHEAGNSDTGGLRQPS
jgi:HemY protein